MSCCLTCSLVRLVLNLIMFGYPAYMLHKTKDDKPNKTWATYFLIFGVFNFLEYTALFPIKWILNKICLSLFTLIKASILYWMYSESFKGAELIEAKFGKFIDLAYDNVNKYVGNYLPLLGYPKREAGEELLSEKKKQ